MDAPSAGSPLVYSCFVLLGVSGLLPWNLFITAHSYFTFKLKDCDDDLNSFDYSNTTDPSYLQRTFEVWLTISGSATCFLGTVINLLLATRVSNVRRIVAGHALVLLGLAPTIALSLLDTHQMPLIFFISSLVALNVCILGSNGFILSASMGLVAVFPPAYIQGFMLGQSVAGVATSSLAIGSQAATPSPQWNGLVYFVLAALYCFMSLGSYFVLLRTEFAQWHLQDKGGGEETEALVSDDEIEDSVDLPVPSVPTVARKICYESILICVTFAATLSAFPALSSLVVTESQNTTWRVYFTPVACFLLFNVGDSVGRMITRFVQWPRSQSPLLAVFASVRIAIVPLILFCNAQPRHLTSAFLTHDWMFICCLLALAVSNGFLISLASIYGSKRVQQHEMEMAGSILSVVCNVGIITGCLLAAAVVHLV